MYFHEYHKNNSEMYWGFVIYIIYNLFAIIPVYSDDFNIRQVTYFADILILTVLLFVKILTRGCCRNATVIDSSIV